MCDTLWKRFDSGIVFAKNSDRACNEPNLTLFIEGGKREEETVQCTYISIPQAERVNSVLLVKPSWIWGAEMGINEYGVAIGNEAVFTKSKGKKEEKLLGMDMLRLALERCDSAVSAKDMIISLLEIYGQGGNCGYDKNFYYDNSFLITDKTEGFIVETAGKEYKVKTLFDYGNISNRLSVDNDFIAKNSEPLFTHFSGSKQRQQSGYDSLGKANSLKDIFNALRKHNGESDDTLFAKGSVKSVCMHQGLLGDHTTGSMVVCYGSNTSIWITGCSTPCISAFKPVLFGKAIPPVFIDDKDSFGYWSKREYLNRAIFSGIIEVEQHRLKVHALEDEFISKYTQAVTDNANMDILTAICEECSAEEEALINSYKYIIEGVKYNQIKLKGQWIARTKKL